MHTSRLLLPIKLTDNSVDTLLFAGEMSGNLPVCITLLNVVQLNVATEPRVYEEVCREGEMKLRRIAREYLRRAESVDVCVRLGKPFEQIIAEATCCGAELILLSNPSQTGWKRWIGDDTITKVTRTAICPTLVLPRALIPGKGDNAPHFPMAVSADWRSSVPAWFCCNS